MSRIWLESSQMGAEPLQRLLSQCEQVKNGVKHLLMSLTGARHGRNSGKEKTGSVYLYLLRVSGEVRQ